MNIVVSATGGDLAAEASPVFGRCPVYIFVDSETMAYEAIENPAVGTASGAGIRAAQFVAERGAQAVVSGNVGPNAFDVLDAAGVNVYLFGGGSVQQAVDAFKAGQLPSARGPSAPAHAGVGGGLRRGMGRGMGRGIGMGMGMGREQPASGAAPEAPAPDVKQQELGELKEVASDLRGQLADLMERLDRMDREA